MWVVGCGVIGGSLALAAKRRWPEVQVVGVDRPKVLAQAQARGAIDRAQPSRGWTRALLQARPDVVVLALPIEPLLQAVTAVANVGAILGADAPLVFDVGSVKTAVLEQAERSGCPRFIGGHPMAGAATGGVEVARADLFDGRTFALCPTTAVPRRDLTAMRALVRGLGARPRLMEAPAHDRAVAMVSHVPHVLAWGLMLAAREHAQSSPQPELLTELAAGSWRDATRVAMADPATWSSIFDHNREGLAAALDRLIAVLSRARAGLDRRGTDITAAGPHGLDARTSRAIRRRQNARLPPVSPGHDASAPVPLPETPRRPHDEEDASGA